MQKKIVNKIVTHFHDDDAQFKIFSHLLELLSRQPGVFERPIVAICIGSDRYTGDSLGPLVGSHLKEHNAGIIFGSLESPVHAGNLVETINMIHSRYPNSIIIAVDACLGKANEIGNIEIWEGSLQAGIAVGNELPAVGHISIIGVVNGGDKVGYLELQTTPLSIVVKLSKMIGAILSEVISTVSTGKQENVLNT